MIFGTRVRDKRRIQNSIVSQVMLYGWRPLLRRWLQRSLYAITCTSIFIAGGVWAGL